MYLRNIWYVGAWASEVGEGLLGRRILDEPVLMYREVSGNAIAIGNRCPHRFAPLHLGRKIENTVQCGYHGLVFGSDGRCIANPRAGGQVPPGTHVKSYPVIEQHGLLWIWMGDPARAAPAKIPDLSFLPREGAQSTDGYLHIRAAYDLAMDNLMDLSHAAFLHEETLGRLTPALSDGELKVIRDGESIVAAMRMPNIELPGVDNRVDQWLDMKWYAPSIMILDIGHVAAGADRPEHGRRAIHIVTPESEHSSHYFFRNAANRKNFKRDPFSEEDEPMLAACQEMMGNKDFWSLKPAILPSDAGAVLVRHRLNRLIREEAGGMPAPITEKVN
jgi:phenylpropionate dioxygenase-like ring-hydroxylating dioxygenase large terminal subunit